MIASLIRASGNGQAVPNGAEVEVKSNSPFELTLTAVGRSFRKV